MKLYTVNEGTEKGFPGFPWTCVCFLKSYVTGLRRTLTYHVLCVPSLASFIDYQGTAWDLSWYLWSPRDAIPL